MNTVNTRKLIESMIEYFGSDKRRINHFLKVWSLAKTIGEGENLDSDEQILLETAAILHDIGIKKSEIKHNSSAGKYQELEGPGEAEKLLKTLGCDDDFIKRVCFIVGHHHTYSSINTSAHRILAEADMLVNLYEENCSLRAVQTAYDKIFRTKTGKKLMKIMYPIN